MGAVSELYAMQRSFSADRTVKHQSRSGDDQDGGAVVLDFLANVQSAEADIIEEEERAEQQESKREFAALLRAYFKKILTADEYRFLVGCIRQNKTLYQVGRALGVNANKTAEDIESKCKASEKQFFLLMSYSGYDCRRGCEFMARLFNPDAHRRKVRDKIQARRQYHSNASVFYRLRHKDRINASRRTRRANDADWREKERLRMAKYNSTHREERIERTRKRRAANPNLMRLEWEQRKDRVNARRRARKANDADYREKERLRSIEYRKAHRDEINARQRARAAQKRAEREAREREQATNT